MLKEFIINGEKFRIYNRILEPQTIRPVNCNCRDIKAIMQSNGVLMARWVRNFSSCPTQIWYVVQQEYHPLEDYAPRTRTRIRRGGENFSLSDPLPVSPEMAFIILQIDEAFGQYLYGRDLDVLKQHLASLTQEYRIMFVKDKQDKPVGYLLLYMDRDFVHIRTIHIPREYQRKQASYFVFYKMSELFLPSGKAKAIVMGMRNFLHPSQVQELLLQKFFYKKLYVRMEICLSLRARIIYYLFVPFMPFMKKINLQPVNKLKAFLMFIKFDLEDKKE